MLALLVIVGIDGETGVSFLFLSSTLSDVDDKVLLIIKESAHKYEGGLVNADSTSRTP